MKEINDNSHITLNIYNNQEDTNKNTAQSEASSKPNNSIQNMLHYYNINGVNKVFPDNLRTVEYNRNVFPLKEKNLAVSVCNNNIRYVQPESNKKQQTMNVRNINNVQPKFIIQQRDKSSERRIDNSFKSTVNLEEKKYCCGKCPKPICIISIVMSSIFAFIFIVLLSVGFF